MAQMPQPIAASTTAKQNTPTASPSLLPPTTCSPAASPPRPGRASARRPTANRAGSPAPAIKPRSTICQSAVPSIHGAGGVGGAAMLDAPIGDQVVAGAVTAGSDGETVPVHSALTLRWLTFVLRARR